MLVNRKKKDSTSKFQFDLERTCTIKRVLRTTCFLDLKKEIYNLQSYVLQFPFS